MQKTNLLLVNIDYFCSPNRQLVNKSKYTAGLMNGCNIDHVPHFAVSKEGRLNEQLKLYHVGLSHQYHHRK